MIRFKKNVILIAALVIIGLLIGCSSQTEDVTPTPENTTDSKSPPSSETKKTQSSETAITSEEEVTSTENEDMEDAESEDEEDDEDEDLDEFEAEFEEAKQEVSDPFEGYNRAMTTFNDALITWVLEPVGKGYAYVVPEAPRRGVRHFFHNLLYPIRFVNNVLQFKIKNAGEETVRFVTNTTIGILGFWDPAKEWFGLEPHEEDFGQTLGFYGVGSGPHIVLPFFGPSNLRDTFSMYPDNFLDPVGQQKPIGQTDNYVTEYGIRGFKAVNEVSLRQGEWESLKKDAIDFYPFLRDSYEQMRNKQIKE